MAAQHPSVKAELDAIEEALEQLALKAATPPRPELWTGIAQKLQPAPLAPPAAPARPARLQRWPLVLATAALLAAGALGWQNQQLRQQVAAAQEACAQNERANRKAEQIYALTRTKGTRTVPLAATTPEGGDFAIAYWNANQKMLILDPVALPRPPRGQQYQLWAIVDAKPLSLGLLPLTTEGPGTKALALEDINFTQADAFAITLEPAGGSPTPTLEALKVMGKI